MMIGRSNRFHGLGSLRVVYRKGGTVRSGQLALKYMPSNRSAYRLAVVVSKKVSKSAVVRNRIRRRVIEAVRLRAAEITKPYDMVITVFQDTLAVIPAQELNETVGNLLKQAGITGS